MKIAVLGGGGWGLALSKLLAENGHHILVWEYNPAILASYSRITVIHCSLKEWCYPMK
jgi:glycerol-3-phosphate dehydrogenase (NAD(P)+)